MIFVHLYGRRIDRPRLEVGVAMDNKSDTICFEIDANENPYVTEGCAIYLKTNTLHVPCKIPLEISRSENQVQASIALSSGMIPYEGTFTGQLQIELANSSGSGVFVWQSYPFEMVVAQTIDADREMDGAMQGAYDRLLAFEHAEAERVKAEEERVRNEAERLGTLGRLEGSLNRTIELIEHIEGTLEADQLGIGIKSAVVDTGNGHLYITLTSGRSIDAGYVIGPKGPKGEPGDEVELAVMNGYVVWKYTSEQSYHQLISMESLAGTDGQEVAIQVDGGMIQWRLGDGAWQSLISLDSLKGADGADGADGIDGANFTILGMYDSLESLKAAHPTGERGDAYVVGETKQNTTYLWDTAQNKWVDVGSLKGEKGDTMNIDDLTEEQKDALCRFTEDYQKKVDTLVQQVDQNVSKGASPTFGNVTATTITANRIIGAVYA